MGDFLRVLIDSIQFIWPFRIVRQWERANYYVCGRYWREVGPGLYPVVPWFCTVHTASAVPVIVSANRQDITLRDGSLLSFSVSAWARVVSVDKAVNTVEDYEQTTREVIEAQSAATLSEVEPGRAEPERHSRLLKTLQKNIQAELEPFGIEVTLVRFSSFCLGVRAHRLLIDQQWHNATGW
jgi:hypothetical protein